MQIQERRWPIDELQVLLADLNEVKCGVQHMTEAFCQKPLVSELFARVMQLPPAEREASFAQFSLELFQIVHHSLICQDIPEKYKERIRRFVVNHPNMSDRLPNLFEKTWKIESAPIRSEIVQSAIRREVASIRHSFSEIQGLLAVDEQQKLFYRLEANEDGVVAVRCALKPFNTALPPKVMRSSDWRLLRLQFLLNEIFQRGHEYGQTEEEKETEKRQRRTNTQVAAIRGGVTGAIVAELTFTAIKGLARTKIGLSRSKPDDPRLQYKPISPDLPHVEYVFDRWASGWGHTLLWKESTTWGYIKIKFDPNDPHSVPLYIEFDFGSDQLPIAPHLLWNLRSELESRVETGSLTLETAYLIYSELRKPLPGCSDTERPPISRLTSIHFEALLANCLERRVRGSAKLSLIERCRTTGPEGIKVALCELLQLQVP
jgi:hypothetical protein